MEHHAENRLVINPNNHNNSVAGGGGGSSSTTSPFISDQQHQVSATQQHNNVQEVISVRQHQQYVQRQENEHDNLSSSSAFPSSNDRAPQQLQLQSDQQKSNNSSNGVVGLTSQKDDKDLYSNSSKPVSGGFHYPQLQQSQERPTLVTNTSSNNNRNTDHNSTTGSSFIGSSATMNSNTESGHQHHQSAQPFQSQSFSLTDRRLKNGRHQNVVPPNNHSPKPAPYMDHSNSAGFASKRATIFSAGDTHQYKITNNNGHDAQLGTANSRYSDHPPHLTNRFSANFSAPTSSQDWVAQEQISNQMLSSNTEVEPNMVNGLQTSSGLLSAFGSSTSASAATAVANIASLINPSTSTTNVSNGNPDMQSPAMPVSGLPRTSHASIGATMNGQLSTNQSAYFGQLDNDSSFTHENRLPNSMNTRNHQSIMVSNSVFFLLKSAKQFVSGAGNP